MPCISVRRFWSISALTKNSFSTADGTGMNVNFIPMRLKLSRQSSPWVILRSKAVRTSVHNSYTELVDVCPSLLKELHRDVVVYCCHMLHNSRSLIRAGVVGYRDGRGNKASLLG